MPAADFVEMRIEESPVHENANTAATPFRLATEKLHMPIRSSRPSPAPEHLDRSDEQRGILGSVPHLIETYNPGGGISERAYTKDLLWFLLLNGYDAVYTAGNGVITDPDGVVIPAGAHRWVLTPRDSTVARTAQIIWNYKNHGMQIKGNGYAIPSLTLNMAGEITADRMGLLFKRLGLDTTTVPTPVAAAIPPIRRGHLFISWLAGGGPLADFSITSAMPMSRHRTASLDPPSNFPDQLLLGEEDGSGVLRVTGSIPKRSIAAADIDALLAATTFAAKARWKTPKNIGATSYKHSVWCEMPAAQLLGGEPGDHGNRRRVDATYDFAAAYDEALGYDVKWTIVNDVAAVATFV